MSFFHENPKLEFNDQIIWDKGDGYEIGYYVGESNRYKCCKIQLATTDSMNGLRRDVLVDDVKQFSIALAKKMKDKYPKDGYKIFIKKLATT